MIALIPGGRRSRFPRCFRTRHTAIVPKASRAGNKGNEGNEGNWETGSHAGSGTARCHLSHSTTFLTKVTRLAI